MIRIVVIEPVGLFAVLKNKITSPYGLEFPIVFKYNGEEKKR
jgi:hypothetical protein